MSTADGSMKFLPLSTNLRNKTKKKMLFYPIDFRDLIIDSLIDTGAISSAISEADVEKTQQITPQNILKECHPPDF